MSKINVGIDISQIVYGTGVSDYTVNLVKALQKLSPELDLTLFGSSFRRQSPIKSLFSKAKTFPFPPTFLHYLWNVLHVVPVENFIGKIDIFHASDWTQPPSHAPGITTVHDLSPFLYPTEMGESIVSVHKARLKWVVKECQKIICVSKSTAEDMQKIFNISPSRLEIIPEALPARFDIDPTDAEVEKIKSQWHLKDYVISVGTSQPRKNYSKLTKAYLDYQTKYRLPPKLVLVGGGGWGGQIPNHPSVIKTGYLPDKDVAALVKGSQSLVLPSLYEGFGLPILLAWRQCTPIAVSNVSSLPEIVGDAAILFDPQNEEAIAAGISNSIKNEKSLLAASYKRMPLYNWDITAQRTYSVYKSLC